MEAVSEKEHSRNESAGNVGGRGGVGGEFGSESLRPTPALQRKISKRREAQEERNVVLDLFKELIGKVNEGYSRVIAAQNNKAALSSKSAKAKSKQRPRPKEITARESKERARKSSSEELQVVFERKEEIWNNYSKLMSYELLAEEIEMQQQPEPTPQATETQ